MPRRRRMRSVGTRAAIALGLVNLIIAGAFYYAAWWPVRSSFSGAVLYKTPIQLTADQLAGLKLAFGAKPSQVGMRTLKDPPKEADPPVDETEEPEAYFTGRAAQVIIPGTLLGWLTLTSVAIVLLSLASGAMWAVTLTPILRRASRVLVILVLIGLGWMGVDCWNTYGVVFPVAATQTAIGILMLFALLVGLGMGRGGRNIARFAGLALILSALGGVIGLFLWRLCGTLPPDEMTASTIFIVFVVHSLWGWLLLFAPRLLGTNRASTAY